MAYDQLKLDNQVCFRLYTAARLIVQSFPSCLADTLHACDLSDDTFTGVIPYLDDIISKLSES
jgi:hypothetical protein